MGRRIDGTRYAMWRGRWERFAEWSGTVAEFCRREGITAASFYQWRKRLTASDPRETAATVRGNRGTTRPAKQAPRARTPFVELSLTTPTTAGASVEIALPNGATVRVPAACPATLRAAIHAAGEVNGCTPPTPSQEVPS
jgi:hypothetical protein